LVLISSIWLSARPGQNLVAYSISADVVVAVAVSVTVSVETGDTVVRYTVTGATER
jgi:hypothetical protein